MTCKQHSDMKKKEDLIRFCVIRDSYDYLSDLITVTQWGGGQNRELGNAIKRKHLWDLP